MEFELNELIKKSGISINRVQDFFNEYQLRCFPSRSPEFFCLELNGEAGELANLEKKKWKGKVIGHELFSDEAADVLIALMNYANARGIDLGKAVAEKLEKIEQKRLALKETGEEY
jgi:NTP pyrophosphatase (non-canonical NTP hydrolase)